MSLIDITVTAFVCNLILAGIAVVVYIADFRLV